MLGSCLCRCGTLFPYQSPFTAPAAVRFTLPCQVLVALDGAIYSVTTFAGKRRRIPTV